MDKVLLGVLESYAVLLADKQIHLQLQVSDTLPRLLIMPCKIARVISNLLDNAIRYSPVSGTIELLVEENRQYNINRSSSSCVMRGKELLRMINYAYLNVFLEQINQEVHTLEVQRLD
ncbi:hypothetical protein DJ93_5708 [Bacillus clarus]|uniref:Histidine kinase-, DNA gyrase B-, and HSP90-like ATPase family protein n=1 Tax=Bacillus clarus TaxID=2338372 RepID=A0A090YSR5_9BACI|nr:hypothetical protein DJ93_5708 [Bacillus clarus]